VNGRLKQAIIAGATVTQAYAADSGMAVERAKELMA